jgi:hypothetical protein
MLCLCMVACVQEIVTSDTLLSSFVPLLVSICSNLAKYPDADLRSAALDFFVYYTVSNFNVRYRMPLISFADPSDLGPH